MANNSRVAVTTSWDDGHPLDLKLAELLSQYKVRGTFYVPLHNSDREITDVAGMRALAQEFEIGGHGRSHVQLPPLADAALREETSCGKAELESLLGKVVSLFSYPWGHHNRRVRRAVVEAGFAAARTTTEFCTRPAKDPWRIPTTLHACPQPSWIRLRHAGEWLGLKEFLRTGPRKPWVQLAQAFFDLVLTQGGVWHLWGHSWEMQERGLWDDLREVLDYVSKREGVVYVSNGELLQFPWFGKRGKHCANEDPARP